jgi:hypothetical protein
VTSGSSPGGPIEIVVNARKLAGSRTGIEVYMEQLLLALLRTHPVRIIASTCQPLRGPIAEAVDTRLLPMNGLRPGSRCSSTGSMASCRFRSAAAIAPS